MGEMNDFATHFMREVDARNEVLTKASSVAESHDDKK